MSNNGGGGGSNAPVYTVPWKVRKPTDAAAQGLVLYWFPASQSEMKNSSLRESRMLSLYASQCVSMEWADGGTPNANKLVGDSKLPIAVLAKPDGSIVNKVENTGGKLKITVHANASLFKATEIKRAVQQGQAQIGEILLVNYQNEWQLYGADGLPFALFTAVIRALVRDLGAAGVAGLLPGGSARELARLLPEFGEPAGSQDAGEARARLVHVSTDLVFDGERGWYTEEDTPAPLSVFDSTSRLSSSAPIHGLIFSSSVPGRKPMSSPTGTVTRVTMISV